MGESQRAAGLVRSSCFPSFGLTRMMMTRDPITELQKRSSDTPLSFYYSFISSSFFLSATYLLFLALHHSFVSFPYSLLQNVSKSGIRMNICFHSVREYVCVCTENTDIFAVNAHCGSSVLQMHKCINLCVAAFVYNDSPAVSYRALHNSE